MLWIGVILLGGGAVVVAALLGLTKKSVASVTVTVKTRGYEATGPLAFVLALIGLGVALFGVVKLVDELGKAPPPPLAYCRDTGVGRPSEGVTGETRQPPRGPVPG